MCGETRSRGSEGAPAQKCVGATRQVTERPVRIADQGYLLARRSVRLKVMTKLVAPLLDTLAEIADDERDILLDTFRVWMENCFCQPKKVGYRLHRIQERTGACRDRKTSPSCPGVRGAASPDVSGRIARGSRSMPAMWVRAPATSRQPRKVALRFFPGSRSEV